MKKIIVIVLISAAAITAGYFAFRKKKPCPCQSGSQEAIIDGLTETELKDHILKIDEKAALAGKTLSELKGLLKKLIADSE